MTAEEIYFCGEDKIKGTELTYNGVSYRPVEISPDEEADKCKLCEIPADHCTETPCDLQNGPCYYWIKSKNNK